MVTTRPQVEDTVEQVLNQLIGRPNPTDVETTDISIDIDSVLDGELSVEKVKTAEDIATDRADDLFEEWRDAENEYEDLLDEIEEADKVDARDLKRQAAKLKRNANSLKEDYDLWVSREQSLSTAHEKVKSLARVQSPASEVDETISLLNDDALEEIDEQRDSEVKRTQEVSEQVDTSRGQNVRSGSDAFKEVEEDLAEREWDEVETEGTDQFGDDIFSEENETDEDVSVSGGMMR